MKKNIIIVCIFFASLIANAQNEIMNVYDATGTNIVYAGLTSQINKITFTQIAIGSVLQGGVLAYIFQPGDPGYIMGETHGIIATRNDISSGIQWSGLETFVSSSVALGTGNTNTNAIVLVTVNQANNAAKLCSDLVQSGFSDWYLPSKSELQKLYNNRIAIGGFTTSFYWSSSQFDSNYAWANYFGIGGLEDVDVKIALGSVRAIRTF